MRGPGLNASAYYGRIPNPQSRAGSPAYLNLLVRFGTDNIGDRLYLARQFFRRSRNPGCSSPARFSTQESVCEGSAKLR